MPLFRRQKWDIATLIFDANELEHCRVRMRRILANGVLKLFQR